MKDPARTKSLNSPATVLSNVSCVIYGVAGFSDEMLRVLKMYYPTSKDVQGKSILEAGCGTGKLVMFFEQFGMYCNGLDIDPEQLNYAEKIKGICQIILDRNMNACFTMGSIHEIEAEDNTFNFCFSEGVIEHFQGYMRQNIVNEMARVASDAVIIFVPWAGSPESMKIASEVKHTYEGMGEKEYPLTEDELRKNLEDAGLHNIDVNPCDQNNRVSRKMLFGVGHKRVK